MERIKLNGKTYRVTRERIDVDDNYKSICVDEEIQETARGKRNISLKNVAIFKTSVEYTAWINKLSADINTREILRFRSKDESTGKYLVFDMEDLICGNVSGIDAEDIELITN